MKMRSGKAGDLEESSRASYNWNQSVKNPVFLNLQRPTYFICDLSAIPGFDDDDRSLKDIPEQYYRLPNLCISDLTVPEADFLLNNNFRPLFGAMKELVVVVMIGPYDNETESFDSKNGPCSGLPRDLGTKTEDQILSDWIRSCCSLMRGLYDLGASFIYWVEPGETIRRSKFTDKIRAQEVEAVITSIERINKNQQTKRAFYIPLSKFADKIRVQDMEEVIMSMSVEVERINENQRIKRAVSHIEASGGGGGCGGGDDKILERLADSIADL
jgi:hypothetical protein